MRILSPGNNQGRVIVNCFEDIPAFPHSVTDDAGNTYIQHVHGDDDEAAVWYTLQQKVPTRVTMSWLHPNQQWRHATWESAL